VKLNAKQLRVTKPTEEEKAGMVRKPIYIVLDNVLDTYNIGGIFRLADGIAASGVILCGGSETPPCSRLHKSAVGTEEWVPWQYFADAKTAITKLRETNPKIKIIAVEQDERAIPISNFQFQISNEQPTAIVVGHETDGVCKEALDMADVIVEIPMWGVNKSLNVIVSTAIAAYKILG
jgi:23S rRNA (guanosine2251-2'-O)-methyltransferase